jgi:hypothetical protein
MGQLALGVRSLIIRLVAFFIMAVLLAWALGGTLWPRPVSAQAIVVQNGDVACSWTARVSSYDPEMPLTYSLKWEKGASSKTYREDWTEVCGFVFHGKIAWTAARHVDSGWVMLELSANGIVSNGTSVANRLEADAMLVEKQP